MGITRSYMATKTAQWLEAKKPIAATILVKADGTVLGAEHEGAI